jgi:peptidoglycan/xylan/chitin deacetylase (PgdA/CDA1 family)
LLAVFLVLAVAGASQAAPDPQVRCRGEDFEMLNEGEWSRVFFKGFNIGAAPPGKFPGEFAISRSQYSKWMAELSELGSNALRVYTLHPPQFYEALAEHNSKNGTHTLWLFQGAWCDLPDDLDFYNESFSREFRSEVRHVVDAVHGAASIPERRGHASGSYGADVSRWVAGYIVGREFEPFAVIRTDEVHPEISAFSGRYLRVEKGTPSECWLAGICDFLVDYELTKYGGVHPVSFTDWPTLDPITHPTERERGGTRAYHDEDAVSLNPAVVRSTDEFGAGFFATFHAYPYYPDFMNLDPGYSSARDEHGLCNYAGYLRELKSHLKGMPLLIGETGVPTSRGVAHLQPQGLNHGGASETEQGLEECRLVEDCFSNGTAGVLLFELFDEWFKDNWLVDDFELPSDRDVLWQNVQDAEEFFGVLAEEPPAWPGPGFVDWTAVLPLCEDAPGDLIAPSRDGFGGCRDLRELRATSDSRYLYLRVGVSEVDCDRDRKAESGGPRLLIGLDVLDRVRGDERFPVVSGVSTRAGMEFVIYVESPDSAALLIDSGYNYSRFSRIADGSEFKSCAWPFRPSANSDGKFERLIVETNRERIDASGRLHPALHLDAGKLKYAKGQGALAPAEGDWRMNPEGDYLEFRIPWALLNITDPSSHSVLDDSAATRELDVTRTDGIVLTVLSLTGGKRPRMADAMPEPVRDGNSYTFAANNAALFTWPGWEEVRYVERRKGSFEVLSSCLSSLPAAPKSRVRARVALWPGNLPAAASVSFDDGTLNQVEYALPILESIGIKASFGLCGAWTEPARKKVELAPGCVREQLSETDARKLLGLGHEIACHGFRHIFLDTLPETALGPELRAARSSLEAAVGNSVGVFHYPFSRWNERVKEEVRAAGFVGARNIGGINSSSPERYLLESVPVVSDKAPTPGELEDLLEETRERNGWLILTYHNVLPRNSGEARCYAKMDPHEPYFVTPATFRSHMRLLKASGFYLATEGDVLTYMLARDNVRLSVSEERDEVTIKVVAATAEVNYVTRLTLVVELPWKKVGVRCTPGDSDYRVERVAGGILTLDASSGSEISIRRME